MKTLIKFSLNVLKSIIHLFSQYICHYITFSFLTAYYLLLIGILCGLLLTVNNINKNTSEVFYFYRYTYFMYQIKLIIQKIFIDGFFNVLFFGCIGFAIGLLLPSIILFLVFKQIYIDM